MIIMVMLLLASSSPMISKDFTISIEQNRIADICDDILNGTDYSKSRKVVLSINIGRVDVSDSLFGLTLYMKYNSDLWYFDTAIKEGTLSESFKDGQITAEEQGGEYILGSIGSISNFYNPIHGDAPLIKLAFYYLGDCPDTSMIVLEELSFTSECKIPYFKDDTSYVYANVADGEERFAKLEYEEYNKVFPQEGSLSNSLIFDLPEDANVESLEVSIDKKTEFNYSNFLSSESLEILETNDMEDHILLKLKKTADTEQYFIKYDMTRTADADFNHVIQAKITNLNECNCAKTIYDTEQNVSYTKTSVEDSNEQLNYEICDGFIKILSPESTVEVYDLKGNCTKYLNTDNISFNDKVNGLYFVIIKAQNKIEKIRYLNIK